MSEFIESFRKGLFIWGELTEVLLNAFSLICIIAGVVLSLVKSIGERRLAAGAHPLHTYFRMVFGGWLVVALEFQLAADIVGTIISPTSENLIVLGAVAIIRTFLNYFLTKELNEQADILRTRIEKRVIKAGDN